MYLRDLSFLRGTRLETLTLLSGLSQADADFLPRRGGWPVSGVCDHLLRAERLFRERAARLIDLALSGKRTAIVEGFEDLDTPVPLMPAAALPFLDAPLTAFNLFVPGFIREALTEFRAFPSRSPQPVLPVSGRDIDALRLELRNSFNQTKSLFDTNPSLDYRQLRYSHPLIGRHHVLQLLRIIAFHERRHQSQIRDILKERPPRPAAV